MIRVAFFGTPDFAVPSLRALIGSDKYDVVCIVSQPDKPVGRGSKVVYGAVKKMGLEHGIPVLQPERISNELHILDEYKPDIIVTCAFGQILRQNVLDYCKYGVINVHGSLLPKYRGSSPIQWAIIKGETKTGVTIMHTDIGLDTGDIILMREMDISEHEIAGELFVRMSELGATALLEALDQISAGTSSRIKQSDTGVEPSKYPMLNKDMAKIDFDAMTAVEVVNFVRGLNPWPVAWMEYKGQKVRVYKASVVQTGHDGSANNRELVIRCNGDGYVRLDIIQLEGGRVLPTRDYVNGRKIII